jgi:hypothetical protein
MPRQDGTGPTGAGAGTGRGRGFCRRPGSGITSFIIQILIENWRPIAGFIATTLIPLIGRKIYLGRRDDKKELPVLTAKRIEEKDKQS